MVARTVRRATSADVDNERSHRRAPRSETRWRSTQVAMLVAMLGVNERTGLQLFGREIIFEEFQPIWSGWNSSKIISRPKARENWSRYLNVTDRRTDRRTDRQTTCNLITALCASIARKKLLYERTHTHLWIILWAAICKIDTGRYRTNNIAAAAIECREVISAQQGVYVWLWFHLFWCDHSHVIALLLISYAVCFVVVWVSNDLPDTAASAAGVGVCSPICVALSTNYSSSSSAASWLLTLKTSVLSTVIRRVLYLNILTEQQQRRQPNLWRMTPPITHTGGPTGPFCVFSNIYTLGHKKVPLLVLEILGAGSLRA